MPIATSNSIVSLINEHLQTVVAIRRVLHAHPQILFTTECTSKLIQYELTQLALAFVDIYAGTALQHHPESANLKGTARTLNMDTRATTKARFFELVKSTAKTMGCRAQITWNDGYPVTNNDPAEACQMTQTHQQPALTTKPKLVAETSMGGEDFSYYSPAMPARFYLIGLNESDSKPYPELYTPTFDFNDKAIGIGMEMMYLLALS